MQIGSANISFGGLASGIDTRAIIDALVQVEQIPILRLEARKRDGDKQLQFFSDLDAKLTALQDVAKTLRSLGDVASVSPTSSDETILTASVSGAAVPATYELEISALAERESHDTVNGFAARDQVIFSGPASYSFDINVGTTTHTVNLAGDVTLDDVRDAINASGAPVNATVINTGIGANPFELVVSADETGTDNAFTFDFTGSPAGLDTTLAFNQTNAAANASFTVNGIAVESQSNDASGVIDGLTLELHDVTAPGSPVVLDLSPDSTQFKAEVQKLVDSYNEVYDLIDAQSQVDEEGQTTAVLFGDSSVRFIGDSIRRALGDQVTGLSTAFASLAEIGVRTGSDGRLSIDDADFDTAVQDDRAGVLAVFATASTGVADRLTTLLDGFTDPIDGLIKTRQDGINDRTRALDDRIDSLNRRLDSFEQRLVEKFAAFETLMSQFQVQGDALTQGLGLFSS